VRSALHAVNRVWFSILCLGTSVGLLADTAPPTSPPVSYLFLEAAQVSPAVSYLFSELGGDSKERPITSPVVSYLYLDLPEGFTVTVQKSATVSYFWQVGGESQQTILLHGRVTDTAGTPLSGATIAATIYSSPVAQTITDAAGFYQLQFLNPGVYNLSARDATHESSIRALTLNANTAQQDFRLIRMSAAPANQQVNRQQNFNFTSGPEGATLKLFDGTAFADVTAKNAPNTNVMTIVLTHGWVIPLLPGPDGIDGWPTKMAANLRTNGITAEIANIFAWDWRTAATAPWPPQMKTPGQGVALGTNLYAALGATYSQPLHFLGHSLGTMVNSAAINFLHGDKVPATRGEMSPAPWPKSGAPFIHVTLFDDAAEVTANTTYSQLLFDGNSVRDVISPTFRSTENNTTLNWSPPLPMHFTWADNYVSFVGFYHENAINVLLQRSIGIVGFLDAHSYSHQWYRQSILKPRHAGNPLGFQLTFENSRGNGLDESNIPPVGLATAYYQSSAEAPQVLSPIPPEFASLAVSTFGRTVNTLVKSVDGTLQFRGNVKSDIQDAKRWTTNLISEGFNYVLNAAGQGEQKVMNLFSSTASLRLSLTTGPIIEIQKQHIGKAIPTENPSGEGNSFSNVLAMAWVPILISTNATYMAFDFAVSGNPVEDALVCGIGDSNLFSLQAKYIPTNSTSSSRLIDATAWAGRTNELFFGLLGGTSTNATLEISNIRFYSLAGPRLNVQITNNIVGLTWPLTAGNYVLEGTDNLAKASWFSVTNVAIIGDFQYEVRTDISDNARFYRLKQQ
jgi:hypothetical protein